MKQALVTIILICINVLGVAQNVSIIQDKTIGGNQGEYSVRLDTINNNLRLFVSTASSISGERIVSKKGATDMWTLKTNLSSFSIINQQLSIGGDGNDFLVPIKINDN